MLLDGVKIVSFCHFLQGPAADQYLADMGAEVIKVEPLLGAYERKWSGADVYIHGVSGFYLSANRNKKSIAINLKSAAGRDVADRLIASADVILENFRPGVFERLGFTSEHLHALNPKLIFASASGYGQSGPLVEKPGQDLLVQARYGLMGATGGTESGPTPIGSTIVDQHGGALLALGIAGALVRVARQGKGTRVEASLLNSAIDLQNEPLVNWLSSAARRDRLKREHNLASWYHGAPYGVYPASDGHVAISLCDMHDLAKALRSPHLAELAGLDRFESRDDIACAVRAVTASRTVKDLGEHFDLHNVWWAPVQYYDELLSDPQIQHVEAFRRVKIGDETVYLVNHPNRYDGQLPTLHTLALEIGEHSREVLEALKYNEEQIEALIEDGAVAVAEGPKLPWSKDA